MATEMEAALRTALIETRAKLGEANALIDWLRQRNDALASFAESQAQKLLDAEAAEIQERAEA